MSDWLVHLVQLAKVGNHPNGENLSITTVYGQPVIMKRGLLSQGDLAVFVPPDSVLPTNPESLVLKSSGLPPGHRVEARTGGTPEWTLCALPRTHPGGVRG